MRIKKYLVLGNGGSRTNIGNLSKKKLLNNHKKEV